MSTKVIIYSLFFNFFCLSCESVKPNVNTDNTGGIGFGNGKPNPGFVDEQDPHNNNPHNNNPHNNNPHNNNPHNNQESLLKASSMRILPNTFNTCYFDSSLQVLFRCKLMDKKTFSKENPELEKIYDRLSDYLLNNECKVAIKSDELRSILEKINNFKKNNYKLEAKAPEDPCVFFEKCMENQFFCVCDGLKSDNKESNIMSDLLSENKINLGKEHDYIVVNVPFEVKSVEVKAGLDSKGNEKKIVSNLKIERKFEPCDKLIVHNPNLEFKLIATINHRGAEISNGHYVAYILDEESNQWKCYDDMKTSAEYVENINFQNDAVLFFYRQEK